MELKDFSVQTNMSRQKPHLRLDSVLIKCKPIFDFDGTT